jgi:hypothetical protein
MKDKYTRAIEYLKAHPREIQDAWSHGTHPAHCLFMAIDTFCCEGEGRTSDCNCLTLVKVNMACDIPVKVHTRAVPLIPSILADDRIPSGSWAITLESLPAFARWQRKIDKVLNR